MLNNIPVKPLKSDVKKKKRRSRLLRLYYFLQKQQQELFPRRIELNVHKFGAQIDIYSIETHNFLVSYPSVIPLSLCVCVCVFLFLFLVVVYLHTDFDWSISFTPIFNSFISSHSLSLPLTIRFSFVGSLLRIFGRNWLQNPMKDEKCLRFE